MKKTLLLTMTTILCLSGIAAAQSSPADEAYIKAMTSTSPAQKAQLLKEYLSKYAGKGSQYENFANAALSLDNYPGKTEKDVIDFGEKALSLGGLDTDNKARLLITVALSLTKEGQNLSKAKNYSQQLIDLANANKNKAAEGANADRWTKFLGAGYFSLAQAEDKGNDSASAVDSYIQAYTILKDPKIMGEVRKMAKKMYDAKNFAGAEKAARALYTAAKDGPTAVFLGQSLYKAGKADEALTIFKEAYAKKQSGELAYNIGLILAKNAKTNPSLTQEAIDCLLEAAYTYPAKSGDCLGMAQSLFFTSSASNAKVNDVITKIQEKNKKIEDLTKSFNVKFADKNEEDLTDSQKAEMKQIQADIDAVKKEISQLQSSNTEMTAKWQKRMEDVKRKLGK